MKVITGVLYFLLTFGIGQISAQQYQASFDIQIPHTPDLVIIDGKPTVYYELHLTNFAADSIMLENLEVFNPADSSVVISCNKDNLGKRYSRIGVFRKNENNIVPPGASGIIYLEFVIQNNLQLAHRLEFKILHKGSEKLRSIQGALINLARRPALILGAPLSNGPWAAVYDPAWETGHRRVIFTVDGKARIPGRFAIDFVRVNDQGEYAKENSDVVKNWYGYGDDVFAAAAGVVAAVRNDFAESSTISGSPHYTADNATGNYISIDIGNSNILFYEHLTPGSIKVKPGQQVKKGDKIATLGFTGQSTGPHLHFHVANANSPLGAEGIPFVFEHFTVLGVYTDFANFGKVPWTPLKKIIIEERPVSNSVLRF
jgi:murein DD-endopeptidase